MIRQLSLIFALSCASQLVAGDWPAFRGPHGNGISLEKNVPLTWSAEENVKWKVALPGPGNSSPIVINGRVFVTCAQDEGKQRSLFCFDRQTGGRLWVKTVDFGKVMPTHKTNPYAGASPVADSKRVIAWHSSAGLYCYDHDGNELWSRNLGEFSHTWGYGASPVIYRDRVVLYCGPGKRSFMTALRLSDGQTLWETAEPTDGNGNERGDGKYMGSWSTPVIANVGGSDRIVCSMPTRVNGYDPETGEIVWYCEGLRGERGDLAYSSPLIADGVCFATGGYRGPAIAFTLGGQGNLTETARIWRTEQNPQSIGSGVLLDGFIYRPNAGPGTIECIAAKTGKVLWTDRAKGANHWGSVILVDGHLFVTNQRGTTVVFRPDPTKFDFVAANNVGESSNATPAFSDGQVFLRTDESLFCIGKN